MRAEEIFGLRLLTLHNLYFLQVFMREMREAVAMNGALLDRHMQFILFNINVMAGTPAEATYTAKDMKKGKKRTGADTKVFDASV